MLIVGITGGIGSGKTTVCEFFEYLQIPVYYSDDWAKELMISCEEVVGKIKDLFGDCSYHQDGSLNRKHLSRIVFTDRSMLLQLNQIVHPAVYRHFLDFVCLKSAEGFPYVILESAILVEIKWNDLVDKTVVVTADRETRIARVICRDGASREDVLNRIDNQMEDTLRIASADYLIDTDNTELLIPRLLDLHKEFLSL